MMIQPTTQMMNLYFNGRLQHTNSNLITDSLNRHDIEYDSTTTCTLKNVNIQRSKSSHIYLYKCVLISERVCVARRKTCPPDCIVMKTNTTDINFDIDHKIKYLNYNIIMYITI